jgi:hypothetical protein
MDIIIAILTNIIAWTIVSTATSGFERYFLYAVIVLADIAYVIGKFRGSGHGGGL